VPSSGVRNAFTSIAYAFTSSAYAFTYPHH
jgi:hypothetical protein